MKEEMKSKEKCVNYEYIRTDPVIDALKDKFTERSQIGIKKYGMTLDENNLDDFLLHLLEEQMDSCAYIMKLIMQREKK